MVFEYDFSHRSEIPAVTRNQIKLLASSSYADSAKMSTADWEEVRRGGLGGVGYCGSHGRFAVQHQLEPVHGQNRHCEVGSV